MSVVIPENGCFHCGLPNTEGERFMVEINHKSYPMCCPGCYAVASAIVDNGLENYYEFRTELAARGDAALDATMSKLAVYDEPELQEEFVFEHGTDKQIQLTVEGITCAACGWLIEKQLAKVTGLKQVSVNVAARRALITWNNDIIKLSGVLQRLSHIGYEALPFQPDEHEASYKKEQKSYLKKLGLAGIMTMQVMMLAFGQYFDVFGNLGAETIAYFNAVSLLLTTPVVLYSGSIFYVSALKAIQARTVNMDVPVTIAIAATYIAGVLAVNNNDGEVYFESICMFVFFLLVSRFLEHRSRHKASELSSNMLKLIPVTALKWDGSDWTSVIAKQLQVNDLVLVKPGESMPIDGIIESGTSTVNESMLTGEFEPVVKMMGDKVYAGTLNQEGSINVKVSSTIKHAVMNQILRLQELALMSKPKIAKVADEVSRYFVIAVLLVSGLTYWYWWSVGNPDAFWITISILVATCPCALGLATPSALTCAMAKLNKLGVLLKRADALEQITTATDIVFDKTGTLTKGEFSLREFAFSDAFVKENVSIRNDKIEKSTEDQSEQDFILALGSFIESRSEHPIAGAFLHDYANYNFSMSAFTVHVGKGISAKVNEFNCHMGSRRFIQAQCQAAEMMYANGTFDGALDDANVVLMINEEIVATFIVTDTVAPEAKALVEKLGRYRLSILSGDEQHNVNKLANELHIANAFGNNTPDGKLKHIKQQQAAGKSLIMLGDGINDAPVLAAADVSIAVGNASDLAKNAADVILLSHRLNALDDLLTMAKKTKSKIKQNIAWALGYNMLVLPFAISGLLSPWQAALGMSLSSIIVVYNSTRLMK
ncbi:heavy metal translocating P-type ATPase [Agaribacter marinus]|nr:heavy metal translocating P-type ATPase [Agaribacter marinus]